MLSFRYSYFIRKVIIDQILPSSCIGGKPNFFLSRNTLLLFRFFNLFHIKWYLTIHKSLYGVGRHWSFYGSCFPFINRIYPLQKLAQLLKKCFFVILIFTLLTSIYVSPKIDSLVVFILIGGLQHLSNFLKFMIFSLP